MPPARSATPRATIAPLLHESLGERVYRTVRDLILSQVFPPGSKLNVEQICRDLGVSRTPVWDAMRRLESEGLVNTVPRHGVFVLNYGADQIRDLFAVRGALEALAVRQAAENLDDDARAALERRWERWSARPARPRSSSTRARPSISTTACWARRGTRC
jgi:DNA-binding GntR family transcriptional regulator